MDNNKFNNPVPYFSYIENPDIGNGYLSPDGNFYQSDNHSVLCKELVYQTYFDKYKQLAGISFNDKPNYTLQEEFYLLKYEKWVKVQTIIMSVDGSIPNKKGIYHYYPLTDDQKAFLNIE